MDGVARQTLSSKTSLLHIYRENNNNNNNKSELLKISLTDFATDKMDMKQNQNTKEKQESPAFFFQSAAHCKVTTPSSIDQSDSIWHMCYYWCYCHSVSAQSK